MKDRELLEFAAKAVGISPPWDENDCFTAWVGSPVLGHWWNPLENDGDALRLAADLDIDIEWFPKQRHVSEGRLGVGGTIGWLDESGRRGALRRAITVAASRIGRAMP